jgi:DNA-binding transcriptional MocR family regulator
MLLNIMNDAKMGSAIDAKWFAQQLGNRSIQGIALETAALIRAGNLAVGSRLPSVRDIAFELGVSPATISEAWSALRRQKILTGRGRNGTRVSGDRFVAKPERLATSGNYGEDVIDLTLAVPDPALLPALDRALRHGTAVEELNSYKRSRIVPELEAAVRPGWPYEAEAFLATSGGYSAIYTVLHTLVQPGAAVAIEHPTALRLLDILEDRGVRILPVLCDNEGPLPASLAEALRQRPVAFLFQPRLHSVTGQTVSPARLSALGDLLDGTDTLIVEDDGVADISAQAAQSLGGRFPERTVHVRSYSKTFGPDLRLAVLSGGKPAVDQVQSFRSFSAGWTSRILQSAMAWLLGDAATAESVARAREIYQRRRDGLALALRERGIEVGAGGGLCVWAPVADEPFAMVTLAARKIAVAPGAKFSILPSNRIRIATGTLSGPPDHIADAVMLASAPG